MLKFGILSRRKFENANLLAEDFPLFPCLLERHTNVPERHTYILERNTDILERHTDADLYLIKSLLNWIK